MANFAKIVGTASNQSDLNANFTIRFQNATRAIDISLNWSCKTVRSLAYQYAQGANATIQGVNALAAVSSDIANHATLKLYMAVATASSGFQIEANEYGWVITNTVNTVGTNFTFTPTAEVVPPKNFELTGYTLSNGDSPCSEVLITITENDGVSPYTWVSPSNASTTLAANISRQAANQFITVTLEDSEADQASLNNVFIPRLLTSAEISSISVVTNAGGLDATVTVFMATDGSEFGGYEYSLDGVTFQTSNVFTGVLGGSYTLFVREGLGCVTNLGFTVDLAASISKPDPYAQFPKANPIRMIRRQAVKYNTLENTLYQNEFYLGENKKWYAQPYENSDGSIPTQFHTNYDTISARILDCDDNIIRTLTPVKRTNNLGSTDKRDAIAFNRGNNQTGIYFTTGNIYDPVTNDVIDAYSLNGQLPEWGVVGNTVILSGVLTGSYLIKQVVIDSALQARVLVIDLVWTSGNFSESIIAECTYDRLPYETYEIFTDMSAEPLLNGVYYNQVILSDSDDIYPELVYDSEWFYVQADHLRTNFIEYWYSDTTGINYSTGFIGAIRVKSLDPYNTFDMAGELSNFEDTNNELTLTNSRSALEGTLFIQEVPRYMVEKLRIIIGHSNILVNGEKWSATEGIEVTNFDKSSLRNVSIKFRRNNYDEFNEDNISIDGPRGLILTNNDRPILQ